MKKQNGQKKSGQRMIEEVADTFQRLFGEEPMDGLFFAPGRANLIGEHTDYNGGHVLPCSLTMGTYAAVRGRSDRGLRLYSINVPEEGIAEGTLDALDLPDPKGRRSWTSYVTGVMRVFAEAGMRMDRGLDMVVGGDLPAGAGLSSSASLEVLTGTILKEMYGFSVGGRDIALYGQRAEREHAGVECGIMDQFACAMGREGCVIDLDTASMDYEYVPLPMDRVSLIITNTNRKHDLRTSAYNRRRRECAEALRQLNAAALEEGSEPVSALCSLSPARFELLSSEITDPVLRRRAAHAVYENDRVRQAVKALREDDPAALGRLMDESHRSLRDLYEVSCFELDVLAETAREIPGVLGSRMMGGGFGGCTISLVRDEAGEDFERIITRTYRQKTGYDCTIYICRSGGGPSRVFRETEGNI